MRSGAPALPRETATTWLRRWDEQQASFFSDREERFAVLCDVLETALAGTPEPVVLDLGCGPGSLAARLHERVPQARIIGLDADPLLLGLAAAAYPEVASWVDADLRAPDWRAQVPARIDAAVSTTALHWLPADALGNLYGGLAELTVPGGVFVNGDHMGFADETTNRLAEAVAERSAARAGVRGEEGWRQWWDAALADPALAELAHARSSRTAGASGDEGIHHGTNGLTVGEHADLLLGAGFRSAERLWQVGNDQVLVGLR